MKDIIRLIIKDKLHPDAATGIIVFYNKDGMMIQKVRIKDYSIESLIEVSDERREK